MFNHKLNPRARLLPASLLALAAMQGCRHNDFPDTIAGYREFAYIANEGDNTLTVLDLVYLRPDRTLLVGKHPVGVVANSKRDEAYVVNAQPGEPAGSVSIVDTNKNTVVATIPVQRTPAALSLDPTGLRAYIANAGSNSVSVLNLETRRAIFSAPTGAGPVDLAISDDGRTLVVANHAAGSVSLFTIPPTTKPGPVLIPRSTFAGCPGAASIAILPDSSKAFIACSEAKSVMVLSLPVLAETQAGREGASTTEDHLLALLEVGDHPTHLTLKPDGGEIFVSNSGSNTISEISTTTNEVGSTYAIGDRPTAGLVSSDNSALWVANSAGESISLYSIADGQFLSSLRTGSAPCALAFSADEHLLLTANRASGNVALIRTASRLGPALFTLMPTGKEPCAIAIKAMQTKP